MAASPSSSSRRPGSGSQSGRSDLGVPQACEFISRFTSYVLTLLHSTVGTAMPSSTSSSSSRRPPTGSGSHSSHSNSGASQAPSFSHRSPSLDTYPRSPVDRQWSMTPPRSTPDVTSMRGEIEEEVRVSDITAYLNGITEVVPSSKKRELERKLARQENRSKHGCSSKRTSMLLMSFIYRAETMSFR